MSKQLYGKYGPGRNADKAPFGKRDITITLKGDEWFVILTILTNPLPPGQLSEAGLKVWIRARKKFLDQITSQTESLS